VVDVVEEDDLELIRNGLEQAWGEGLDVLVRSASPLAALLAGCRATRLTPAPAGRSRVLVVAGSYVPLSTRQLAELQRRYPGTTVEADIDRLLENPAREQSRLAGEVEARLRDGPVCALSTPRVMPTAGVVENGLGERISERIAGVLEELVAPPDMVVGKGGITSAVVARLGMHGRVAWVQGPPLPGLSWWNVGRDVTSVQGIGDSPGQDLIVFAGNVGDDATLADLVDALVAA